MPGPIWLQAVGLTFSPVAIGFVIYEVVRARRERSERR